uniref:Putative ovule protein n=1 Tax=Solanum chacoense TaxID=4108 RepID=A0A0V0GW25_SOLCH
MWKEVAEMRKVMRYGGLKKEPGCSWIEIKSVLHMFLVGDKAHPRCNEIYENLDTLISEMKRVSHILDNEFLFSCEATEDEHQHPFPECRVSLFRPIQLEPISGCDGGMQGKEPLLHVDPRKSLGILSCMCWLIPGLHLNISSLPNDMHTPWRTLSIFSDNSTV